MRTQGKTPHRYEHLFLCSLAPNMKTWLLLYIPGVEVIRIFSIMKAVSLHSHSSVVQKPFHSRQSYLLSPGIISQDIKVLKKQNKNKRRVFAHTSALLSLTVSEFGFSLYERFRSGQHFHQHLLRKVLFLQKMVFNPFKNQVSVTVQACFCILYLIH